MPYIETKYREAIMDGSRIPKNVFAIIKFYPRKPPGVRHWIGCERFCVRTAVNYPEIIPNRFPKPA